MHALPHYPFPIPPYLYYIITDSSLSFLYYRQLFPQTDRQLYYRQLFPLPLFPLELFLTFPSL